MVLNSRQICCSTSSDESTLTIVCCSTSSDESTLTIVWCKYIDRSSPWRLHCCELWYVGVAWLMCQIRWLLKRGMEWNGTDYSIAFFSGLFILKPYSITP